MQQWTFAFVAFAVLTAVSFIGLWLFGLWIFDRNGSSNRDVPIPGRRRLAARIYGGTCAALYFLIVAEVLVGLFAARSDGYGVTLSGRTWFARHWQLTNEFGFRDRPMPKGDERILLVLGDSISAGHGIADTQDRFAQQLEASLGKEWRVPVFAKPGWNLGEELTALEECPLQPERVLLQYSLTDIETAANECGFERPKVIIPPPPKGFRTLIARSHLLNWIYWRVIRKDFGSRYWTFLSEAYANPTIWEHHERLFRRLIETAQAKGAPLYVTLWPDLSRVDECAPLLAKVAEFLRAEGVQVLNLTDTFRGREIPATTVNELDDHPNESSHREAAQVMLEWLALD